MILAGVDIGTNTLRLLIADVNEGTFQQVFSDRIITRLGQNLDRSGVLAPEAMERSVSALVGFAGEIRNCQVAGTMMVGTSALRNAANSRQFLDEVKQRTGFDITVIHGHEEGRLTLRGVSHALNAAKSDIDLLSSSMVIDTGGGSTEVLLMKREGTLMTASLPLGAVYLTEKYLQNDPVADRELEELRSAIRMQLQEGLARYEPDASSILVGTAGTITTLAAMELGMSEYDPEKINRTVLTREKLDDRIRQLSAMTSVERMNIRGLEQGREDIILAGAVVVQEIMSRYGFTSLVVSEFGLREGILLDLYDKLGNKRTLTAM